jgi:moderate conductance mechanosensitive channel
LHITTARMTRIAEQHAAGRSRIAQVKTLASVIRATGIAIIAAIATLQILDALGINLAPLLASAGVAGVAIGLAAQSLVKDMLNGIIIIIEDQFDVGDTVRLAGVAGTVEAMTLRKTTVRDGDGTLYVIPNSQITTVANLSADYSVATINVSVDFSANPDKVQEILQRIAMEVRNTPDFKNLFLADPANPRCGFNAWLATHLPCHLQDRGDATVRPDARVSTPCAPGSRTEPHAARRSQPGLQFVSRQAAP